MLVRFQLENWMSFREPASLSLVATKERQHGERVPKVAKYQTRVLPVAAIYGGNASGKTNLFRALHFAKHFVVRGTVPDARIAVEPFRLDPHAAERASRFDFEILVGDQMYAYTFAVTRAAVLEERLVHITSTSERVLFDRRDGAPHFDAALAKDPFLGFAFRGTRDNQLFLTNAVSQRVETFRPVYDWFKDTLELVAPDSRFEPFERFFDEDGPILNGVSDLLPGFDLGFHRLGGEDVPFDALPIAEPVKAMVQESLPEGATLRVNAPGNERFIVSRRGGELKAQKLVTFHTRTDGAEVRFDLRHESDGSQRLVELLPAFLDVTNPASHKVYVMDELDRSLHTLLTRRLLEATLEACGPRSRSQLLLTTHDVSLMDQDLFRRDEMWLVERDATGASSLTAFSDFKDVRYDKDVRKSYLQGRLGGIPRLRVQGGFGHRAGVRDGGEHGAA
ncbi:MAG: hypothetical protein RLZZ383_1481 [Pseudomonadota bacterium]|jgi:AAA15 family ATPase/GTPase